MANINLTGNYQYNLDDKGRLTIPSKLREQLGNAVVVSLNFDNTLALRRKVDFETFKQALLNKNQMKSNVRIVTRTILGNSFELDFDSQGRILIPEILIKTIQLKKNVQIIGVGDKLEIISLENWNTFMKKTGTGILEKAAEDIDEF